ncbi:regulatory protein RecX [Micrococcoides hystricis]|uniref:Regulatory protein RecX n=1 Tax=Micrococcoides hystricis TaxID=1572761 RepID=A0ABV6PA10_9MICC
MSADRAAQLIADLQARIEEIESGPSGTSEELTEVADNEESSKARGIILRQLNAGPRTRHQLAQKLAEAEIDPDLASDLLDRYTELGLINDAQFARDWVEQRHEIRGLARGALRRELQDKGIEQDVIEDALTNLDRDDERARAHELLEKRLRTLPLLEPRTPEYRKTREKYVRRLVGHLQRKGYDPSLSFALVNEALDAHQI